MLFLVAVGSVLRMVLLKFADICFPAKLILIYKVNGGISLIRGNVLSMSINSQVALSLLIHHQWSRFYLMLLCYNSDFHIVCFCFYLNGLLVIIWSYLLSKKADDFMFIHSVVLLYYLRHGLQETYHGFAAGRVEVFVVSCFHSTELFGTFVDWVT
jgi:hypothetical protein